MWISLRLHSAPNTSETPNNQKLTLMQNRLQMGKSTKKNRLHNTTSHLLKSFQNPEHREGRLAKGAPLCADKTKTMTCYFTKWKARLSARTM